MTMSDDMTAGLPPGSLQMNDYLMQGTMPVAQVNLLLQNLGVFFVVLLLFFCSFGFFCVGMCIAIQFCANLAASD